ncbi:hypothetical protein GXP67_00325 [Rhodocytophaga rosea]|uniref:Uncharacterized protein n=1 Tax=Rhodocytophaga rosea TaxID=2704465 RepID=A0A6C0GBF4_9BACT|nr:hypothetical protein [Rhodocytophaga rosea]QHT65227.1 hypothetical protein GXP67_00325 [Rhodocytophaga rosea]
MLALEIAVSFYLVQASRNSDPAGKAMGQGLGYLGLTLGVVLTILLLTGFFTGIKSLVTGITLLACLTVAFLVLSQVKDTFDASLDGLLGKGFQSGSLVFPPGKPTSMARAIAAGDTIRIRTLAAEGLDLGQEGYEVKSYLHYAIQLAIDHGHSISSLRALLEAGADPNLRAPLVEPVTAYGKTGLEAMEMLLQKGADPNQRDIYRVPVLHHGVVPEKLKLLVAYRADINATSAYEPLAGYTPLMSLLDDEAWKSVLFLMEKGADTERRAEDGTTFREMMRRRRNAFNGSQIPIPPEFKQVEQRLGLGLDHPSQ